MLVPGKKTRISSFLLFPSHIDDLHANLEEVEQDEVKTWFMAQMTKAKKFQPLVALNQTFKGLDVFESNDAPAPAAPTIKPKTGHSLPEPTRVIDPDEVVTSAHWQRQTYSDSCADPMCGKRLGGANGSVNCRHCGKLFCEEHTMYQMKLTRQAKHEPLRGIWCRVCETCYKSRDGYNDHKGRCRRIVTASTADCDRIRAKPHRPFHGHPKEDCR
jgi:rabenosyn-5